MHCIGVKLLQLKSNKEAREYTSKVFAKYLEDDGLYV
jgi:hypothetical protein